MVRKLKHCVTANVAPIIVLLFKEQHLHVDMIIFFFALFYFDVATFIVRSFAILVIPHTTAHKSFCMHSKLSISKANIPVQLHQNKILAAERRLSTRLKCCVALGHPREIIT